MADRARLDELWPPCGPCAFCGGPDKRHRTWDMIGLRFDGGETIEELAADYGLTLEHIEAAIEQAAKSIVCSDCSPTSRGLVTLPAVERGGEPTCWRCGNPGRVVYLPPGSIADD